MSFLEMPDSIMPIEPTPEERVIASMTDQQIADIALEAVRYEKTRYEYLSIIDNPEAFIKQYAKATVIFNGYREKAQEKVEAFEKMVTSVSKHVEPSMSVETSIKPTVDHENIKTVEGYYDMKSDNSLHPMYDDYLNVNRGPVR